MNSCFPCGSCFVDTSIVDFDSDPHTFFYSRLLADEPKTSISDTAQAHISSHLCLVWEDRVTGWLTCICCLQFRLRQPNWQRISFSYSDLPPCADCLQSNRTLGTLSDAQTEYIAVQPYIWIIWVIQDFWVHISVLHARGCSRLGSQTLSLKKTKCICQP